METLESIASSDTFVCGFHDCVSARPLPGGSVLLYCTQVRRHVTPPHATSHAAPCVCVRFTGLMLGSLLLVSLCVGAAAMFDSQLDVHWELWKKTHEKKYQNQVSS